MEKVISFWMYLIFAINVWLAVKRSKLNNMKFIRMLKKYLSTLQGSPTYNVHE